MAHADTSDLELALNLCDQADEITAVAYMKTDLVVGTKPDRSPVSEGDRAVELALRETLAVERPGDQVLGEEFGARLGGDGATRRWIIDPIDGTANFIRGLPFWATLLALEVSGEVVLGVVSAPALGRRWWAGRGLGAFMTSISATEPKKLSVSAVADLSDSYVLGSSLTYWDDMNRSYAGWLDLASQAHWDRSVGDFWTHMLVAEGGAEVGVDPIGNLWDLAALKVIVEEAGGTFTDFAGDSRADGGNGVSSNGLLHVEALRILNK